MIVEADADVEDAAARCAANAFSFAGQSCISVQRIFVQEDVYDAFRDAFVPRVEALVVGDPAEEETDVGPLISAGERERVLAWIDEARGAGPTILAGGTLDGELAPPDRRRDARRQTRISRATRRSGRCARSSPTRRSTRRSRSRTRRATASRRASSRPTSKRALRATRALEFGGVTVNEAPTFRADQMPYGGVKDSGNTREGPGLGRPRDDRGAARRDPAVAVSRVAREAPSYPPRVCSSSRSRPRQRRASSAASVARSCCSARTASATSAG